MGCPWRHPRLHFIDGDLHFYALAPKLIPREIDGGEIKHDVCIHNTSKYFALRLDAHPLAQHYRRDRLDRQRPRVDGETPRVDFAGVLAIDEATNDPDLLLVRPLIGFDA